jgi:hypothetical protein
MTTSAPRLAGSTATPVTPTFSRGRCLRWACAYALAIIYVSVVLGPNGVNFVPRDPAAAWQALLATPYVATGSDQRPDWMANLVMLVPLGFLAMGAVWPRAGWPRRVAAAGTAFLACLIFVVAVKYAQLFFPPRTVSLNYILAQSLGSLIGVALFCWSRRHLAALRANLMGGGNRPLVVLCSLYALAYLGFLLFPFDFALSSEDLRERAQALPHLLLSFPGAALPGGLRLLSPAAEAAATIPIGVLLALTRRAWPLGRIALTGLLIMSAASAVEMLLLDATPTLAGLGFRTAGTVAGGLLARRLAGGDPRVLRDRLAGLVPWLAAPYAIAVLYLKGLLAPGWRTIPEAMAALDPLGRLPFYHDYIVSKAHAAQSLAFELMCFGPVGLMVALRRGGGRGAAWLAAAGALAFSLTVELGRWLKPGLQPDFSNPIVAVLGAVLAMRLTALVLPAAPAAHPAPARGGRGGRDVADERLSRSISPKTPVHDERQRRPAAALRLLVFVVCLAAAGVLAVEYPIAPWLFGLGLALYAAALWSWPSLWLAVLPASLAAFDLAPWTGWVDVGEPDLVALVTVAILALRAPPGAADFRVRGLAAAALGLAAFSCIAGVALGLAMPAAHGGSDNPYLRPEDALRVGKGFLTALALLPFLRERLRRGRDGLTWLGAGMVAGLVLVSAVAIVERALFPGLLDFSADYRVAATFSSMHIGGGYIGAYLAMALPFLLVGLGRPSLPRSIAVAAFAIGAGYALIVTFARAAYAAASISLAVACLGWAAAERRAASPRRALRIWPALVLAIVAAVVGVGVVSPIMAGRIRLAPADLASREDNWTQGLALRGPSLFAALFGSGLGTYPRVELARAPGGRVPTNFVLGRDGGYRFLSLEAGLPLYFGQKVAVEPDHTYRLFLGLRSHDPAARLTVMLCEKWLLYSENCRSAQLTPRAVGAWEDFGVPVATSGFRRPTLFGWWRRPVELALVDLVQGTALDIGHVRFLDPQGRDLLANGDFSHGTERWFFTDDDHLVWRVENQYLMNFIEGGAVGLAAFVLLAGAALVGAARGMARGDSIAACVAGALAGFLVCATFNSLLDAPRLATMFYLIAFCGLEMLSRPVCADQLRATALTGPARNPPRAWRWRGDRPH